MSEPSNERPKVPEGKAKYVTTRQMEANEKDFQAQMAEVEQIKRWKDGVTRALWIIFGTMAAIIIRMIMMHSENI